MKRNLLKVVIRILITLAAAFVCYYIFLPPLNIHSSGMYVFFIFLTVLYMLLSLTGSGEAIAADMRGTLSKVSRVPFIIIGVLIGVMILGSIWSSVFLHTKAYSSLLTIGEGNFTEEVAEISFDQIPMLDSASATVLADRKLGELSDLVSQFEVSTSTAQISYKNKPVRVTYLTYGDFFKWLNNRQKGIPAYVSVDMVSQEVSVVRLDEGIKYSPSEYFFRNINRYLRFKYPTYIFGNVDFEVDEDGKPYWVATVLTKTIGLFGGEDAKGVVLVDAVTGESTFFDAQNVPLWVDRVYTADLIISQYDYYGRYKNGYLNAFFGQTGCTATTDGYNYITQDSDVWVYTGITSIGGDESNVGFILVNQRTKETRYYPIAGAEEYSAMNSAKGAVQQFGYSATFPLLLNLSGQPTYFMALKDASNLVKMYAMVNVQQYQVVATGTTVALCEQEYLKLLAQNGIIVDDTPVPVIDKKEISGVVAEIRSAVLDGSTWYYIRLLGKDVFYRVSAAESATAIILDVGDRVTLNVAAGEAAILDADTLIIQ